ncbi:DUF1707 domain-containing protein [Micromonospora sp. NPDC000207]|uniref:DUF1707 SHOCT-like domain-containing protein n=1 Tax=Micromonospora sp. NPDC000207 TaxID=3154246 RepID=UPI0033319C18
MDQRDGMRAADADREVVAGRLRAALDEGRLDLHEYDERLQRTFTARTYGELDAVLTDLPVTTVPRPAGYAAAEVAAPTPSDPAAVAQPAPTRSATLRWLADTWEGYLTTVAVTMAVWGMICLLSGELLYFWPGWVAGPWGAVLMVSTVIGLSKGEPERWAAKEEQKRLRKAEKRARKREAKAAEQGLTTDPGGGAAFLGGGVGGAPVSGPQTFPVPPARSAGGDGVTPHVWSAERQNPPQATGSAQQGGQAAQPAGEELRESNPRRRSSEGGISA